MQFEYFFGVCFASFIFGSIPFGYIIGKLVKNIDVRDYYSHNIGFVNCRQVIGNWAYLVLLLDMAKGYIPVYFCINAGFAPVQVSFVGLLAILGHCYPLFLNFKGGKGVATSGGVILAVNPYVSLIGLMVYLLISKASEQSTSGAVLAIITTLTMAVIVKLNAIYLMLFIIISMLIIFAHKNSLKSKSSKSAG